MCLAAEEWWIVAGTVTNLTVLRLLRFHEKEYFFAN
jgi:hypothetical protein